ncbi:DmX-like protein 1 [Gracilariopsis chorda]|uniref:DmX-like protein 1 n=1 Tax=Gracilariopsis chorda TaxID=448386 RepID=A0A2V3IR42_9FLOR|nr:DmX-like protein 1 [Gracilariopsis chorda]|eukprot:PXF44595.1 DmX-like protein 1 [Gracilariopsis chorda]
MPLTQRPPPYPPSLATAAHDEHADLIRFATALRPPPHALHTQQRHPPAVSSHSGVLDVLLFKGVLLVAYAAADEVVIARGTDLNALRRLRPPAHLTEPHSFVTAVAFRQHDAAVAVAFGNCIVVFEGWSSAARELRFVYDYRRPETVIPSEQLCTSDPIVSLSWNSAGDTLCAVADSILLWKLDFAYLPTRYTRYLTIPSDQIPALPLALGSMSPDATYVAVSCLYARVSYIFAISTSLPNPPCAEVVHGRSGISNLDWKKRGGGNQALMTTDRDGTIRLWVRASSRTKPYTETPAVAIGPDSWIEEIARSPHVERTPRAGAAFLCWGGGGGIADDEGDAMATNAALPFLVEGTAPKPSRCYHWIVRVAGGDARAWRVRGLDDRPRAEFARLEPANGDPFHGLDPDIDINHRPPDFPLHDVTVAAVKAVAPIPLTTSSKQKIGLVKSYAISNGERRLRSPEPPEPPNLIAIFVLAVRQGIPFLARYDICPTSDMPAVCRARVGVGHTSPVVDLVTTEHASSSMLGSSGWLASRGRSGDVLVWRTNASLGALESLTPTAALPGPHTAVAFSPVSFTSRNVCEMGIFTCDAALGSLRLFHFINYVNKTGFCSARDVQYAKQVAVCHSRARGGIERVTQLMSIPLTLGNSNDGISATCAVLGVRENGRLCVWRAARYHRKEFRLEPYVVRVSGGRHETVTCICTGELTSTGRHILVTGGADGSLFIYVAGESQLATLLDFSEEESDDEEAEEGVVWLRELAHLSPENGQGPVKEIEMLCGGLRIMSLHSSGAANVWTRDSVEGVTWHLELTTPSGVGKDKEDVGSTASIGFDYDTNFSMVVLREDGSFQRHRRALGSPWECLHKNEVPTDRLACQQHCLKHIGKSVYAVSSGRGLCVLGVSKFDAYSTNFKSNAAGYSPAKSLIAQLLTGGRAWQFIASLEELHKFLRAALRRNASESSYGAGRGLSAPPPPLSILTSDRDDAPAEQNSSITDGVNSFKQHSFQIQSSQNLFAKLMEKSEAHFAIEFGTDDATNDDLKDEDETGAARDLSKLAARLRVVSLAGLSRSEQGVLSVIAKAITLIRPILNSLDVLGARFAMLASCYRELSKTATIPLSIVANAVHSSSSDALMDYFLPPTKPGQSLSRESTRMWETAKALGAGWWVSSGSDCKRLAERIARADFTASRNPDDAALWYVALGRTRALSALYRAQQNTRLSQFLLRDFRKEENRLAARKNAFVLVSKHRLALAIAFFILGDDITGALKLARTRAKDEQLALFLSRILRNGEYVQKTLQEITSQAEKHGDDHQKSLALWFAGQYESALTVASQARYPSTRVSKSSDVDRALAGSLPAVAHALAHVLALCTRPPIRGTSRSKSILRECRRKAVRSLLGDGSVVAALMVSYDILRGDGEVPGQSMGKVFSKRNIETTHGMMLLAAAEALQERAVSYAGAVRSGATEAALQEMLETDVTDLKVSPLGLEGTVKAVECAVFELVKEDEVDCAISTTYATLEVLEEDLDEVRELKYRIEAARRNCLRVAVSRALFHVQGSLSLLHHPELSGQKLSELLGKYKAALNQIERCDSARSDLMHELVMEFRGSVLSLKFALAFLRGDWPTIWYTLRACEVSWQPKLLSPPDDGYERDDDDMNSMTSGCSSLAPDTVSIEALRHVASNPAILSISPSLGHIRRFRRTPSISMVGDATGFTAAITDDSFGAPMLSVSADDPFAVIRIHPALSSTLAAASAAYLSAHLAAHAADYAKRSSEAIKSPHRSTPSLLKSDREGGYDQSFRLIQASETLEQLAEDAMCQWVPLRGFGVEAIASTSTHLDEAAGAFVDLWTALGCLPEYAPTLSEAATVAAAEMAAAASKAVVEAAEQKEGKRRLRRKRERHGEVVTSAMKEGLKLFDTTSADSLFGAYPVRFSSSAQGPWSGKGRHASLYREERALFRTLCVSATDPPAIIVATPKGIQEIVPSSYTTMPAGFRSHYKSRRTVKEDEKDARLEALQNDRDRDSESAPDEDDSFLSAFDGFGEGPYVPLDMSGQADYSRSQRSVKGKGKKAIWRHQVEATTLASHPLRRRFASGGTDGVVRLWDFADPISLASFREDRFGRVADVCFSAYGNTLLAVYSSGHVTIWDESDIYSSRPRLGSRTSRAKVIRAFDNRVASGGTFLDERHTIAVVGDATAPPSVGHSLRIFDTREPHSSFHASWSAAVNHQHEARCLALLEDRMRVVTGGLDGSLSVVDIRTKACVAELPAHESEVTCLALEMPRGRALVSGSSNGEIKLWDSRTLLQLDVIQDAHKPTRHYWSGDGFGGLVGFYGTQGLALTDRSLISCGGDGVVKIWGPGWSDFDLSVL